VFEAKNQIVIAELDPAIHADGRHQRRSVSFFDWPLRERKRRMDRRAKPGGDAELFRDAE
jgi:hypothetical protein